MHLLKYWPVLLGPLAIISVYIAQSLGVVGIFGRETNEVLAMPLIGLASLMFAISAYRNKNEFYWLLAVLTLGFFCREWHFAGTHKGVYVVFAFCVLWGLVRIKHVFPTFLKGNTRYWVVAGGCTYALAVLVQRRLFAEHHLGILPLEGDLHIHLEETIENTAHLTMLICSLLLCPWKAPVGETGEAISSGEEEA